MFNVPIHSVEIHVGLYWFSYTMMDDFGNAFHVETSTFKRFFPHHE